MKPFAKLFCSITTSSIWRENDKTRIVWITLLALSDKDGEVWASVGGLSDAARVSRKDCLKALKTLMSNDEDSRTKDHDGRRVCEIDGGWKILNYLKYRELGRGEDRKEYFRLKKQAYRKNRMSTMSTKCPQESTVSTKKAQMSPIAEAESVATRAGAKVKMSIRQLEALAKAVRPQRLGSQDKSIKKNGDSKGAITANGQFLPASGALKEGGDVPF